MVLVPRGSTKTDYVVVVDVEIDGLGAQRQRIGQA